MIHSTRLTAATSEALSRLAVAKPDILPTVE
jgi:hypothetical protein